MNTRLLAAAALLSALMVVRYVAASAQIYRLDVPREIQVIVNGDRVDFPTVGPREVNGRLLVPLRGVLERMGAFVDWDAVTQTVLANRDGTRIEIPIGSRYAMVNGERVFVDVAPITVFGITMVPLRFLSETLGARVTWEERTNTARISSGDGFAGRRSDESTINAYRRQRRERADQNWRMPVVESVDTSFMGGNLGGGDTIHVTMRATPGGRAYFRISGVVGELKMQETSPGVYEGSWTAPMGRVHYINRSDILAFVGVGGRSTAEMAPR